MTCILRVPPQSFCAYYNTQHHSTQHQPSTETNGLMALYLFITDQNSLLTFTSSTQTHTQP